MCLIIAVNEKTPPLGQFELANTLNPDGIGMAWIAKNGNVQWYKGLALTDVEKLAPYTPLPYVVHFRIATSGGINKELCHPFPISRQATVMTEGQAKQVMFHNGIWFEWREFLMKGLLATGKQLPHGPWSDTRALAFLAYHYGDKILELSEEKIVVLSKEGSKFYGRGWLERDGCAYSNEALFMPIVNYGTNVGYDGTYSGYQSWYKDRVGVDDPRSDRQRIALGGCEDGWDEDVLHEATNRALDAQDAYDRRLKEVSTEIMEKTDTTWFRNKQYKFKEVE